MERAPEQPAPQQQQADFESLLGNSNLFRNHRTQLEELGRSQRSMNVEIGSLRENTAGNSSALGRMETTLNIIARAFPGTSPSPPGGAGASGSAGRGATAGAASVAANIAAAAEAAGGTHYQVGAASERTRSRTPGRNGNPSLPTPSSNRRRPVPSEQHASDNDLFEVPLLPSSSATAAEDAEEHAALARAEATAAIAGANRVRIHGAAPPTPIGDFAHLPIPVRGPMQKISEWIISPDVHVKFAAHCTVDRNSKLQQITDMIDQGEVSFVRYWESLKSLKNLQQWKARLLATGMPAEAVTYIRSAQEAGRLLGITYIYNTELGEPIPGDLRSRAYFIPEELETWLGEG